MGGLAIAAGAALAAHARWEPAVHAGAPPSPAAQAPTEIAIVATPHDEAARQSDVRLVRIEAKGAHATNIGTLRHAPGGVLRGDVLRGERAAVVVADGEAGRGADWAAELYVAREGSGVRLLATGVYHASRPLASADGLVYVERGTPGAPPRVDEARAGELRTDDLHVDAVEPATGVARAVYRWTGYTLHIAGELGGELLIYRVAYGTSEIVAVERATGRSRIVAAVPPFARDFSVDARHGALVMSNRDDRDATLWATERVDLATGARTRLASSRDEAPAPFALADGTIALAAAGGRGFVLGTTLTAKGPIARTVAPLGPGFDALTSLSDDGEWATLHHVRDATRRGFDVAAALHVPTAIAVPLTTEDERVEALGFVGGSARGAR